VFYISELKIHPAMEYWELESRFFGKDFCT